MNIANTVASKLFVAFVAAAMLVMLATPAKAATAEELQAQINALMAQIAALQGSSAPVAAGCTFTRALTVGAQGEDVKCLQTYLTPTYFSNAGGATGYFGPVTAAAVAAWQTANGVTPAAGYFGPVSQAKYAALVAAAPATPGTSTSDDEDDDMGSKTLSGEADLVDYTADDADDSSIDEGAENEEVAVFTASFENGDAMITRLDVSFDGSDPLAKPWDAFESAALIVDGDVVAEKDMSSKGDYLGDEANGIIRFSGLDIVAMEDEDLEITLAVTVQSGLDAEELGSTWTVTTESLRFVDGDDVTSTDTLLVDDESADFTIDEKGTSDQADVKKNTNNPEAATLLVDDKTRKSEEFDIFTFNIDVDEDSSDLVLGDAVVTVNVANPASATTTTTANKVISKVYLTIDGEKVTGDEDANYDAVIAAGANQDVVFTFDFDDYEIAADDVYEATLSIVFEGQNEWANYQNGVVVSADVDGADWDLEGVEGDNVLSGTQSGKDMTLATVVPDITDVTSSTDKNDAGTVGTISFEFTVGADGDDVLLAVANNAAVNGATDDVMFTKTGTDITTGVAALTKVSGDATYAGGNWTISDGDEATFALDVTFTMGAGDSGTYRVTLDSVGGVDVDKTSAGLALVQP